MLSFISVTAQFETAEKRTIIKKHSYDEVAFLDYDGDSDIDYLTIGGEKGSGVQVYLNSGDSRDFYLFEKIEIGVSEHIIAFEDFDEDGIRDIISADNSFLIRRRILNGGFEEVEVFHQSSFPNHSHTIADYDSDGDKDFLRLIQNTIGVFENIGGLELAEKDLVELPFSSANRTLEVIDFDGNGDNDLVIYDKDSLFYFQNDDSNYSGPFKSDDRHVLGSVH